ncbi:MAG: CDGSH iron-sulfur domain-containing protein [Candidatus Micrarchaeia archaeon]|jgi:CDGSH-type Zn-finger protein
MAKAKISKKKSKPKIQITKDGPYLVSGSLPLQKEIIIPDSSGYPYKWQKGEKYPKKEAYALCRCGHSTNKPYCTGKHSEFGFVGTEAATRKKYFPQSEKTAGGNIVLTDVPPLCALARFCERAGGVWKLAYESKNPKSKKLAIQEAHDCPSGRLVIWDRKTRKPMEKKLKPSISIVEDPQARSSGPLWVKGGVPVVSADGKAYEIRNRVTLCRCGRSHNKPFCDGTHTVIKFNDGDKRLKK